MHFLSFPCNFSLHNAYVYEIHNLYFHWYFFWGGGGGESDNTKWGFDNLRTDFNFNNFTLQIKILYKNKNNWDFCLYIYKCIVALLGSWDQWHTGSLPGYSGISLVAQDVIHYPAVHIPRYESIFQLKMDTTTVLKIMKINISGVSVFWKTNIMCIENHCSF